MSNKRDYPDVMQVFGKELDMIVNPQLKFEVCDFMVKKVPDYFWEIGASSTGRYHPQFSQGEGGLVRHTKAVIMFLDELLKMSSYAYMKQEYKDYAVAAALLHDTFKYGDKGPTDPVSKKEYKYHAARAADEFSQYCIEKGGYASEFLLSAMYGHMGQWTEEKSQRPFTSIDRVVHLADYMASRNFIDIPELSVAPAENDAPNG